ncbi:MAG: FtsQ-type POTRA domain-containing protein [Candidatus Omnitrophica bacterium]|nr:FtsQ-type POTRA domain-containing protein [Candidatus Omnitrophota bacterium]
MAKHRPRSWHGKLFRRWKGGLLRLITQSLPFTMSLGVLCLIFFSVRQMVHADPYFQIVQITVFPSGILNLSEYEFLQNETRGKNVAEIDLKQISRSLERNPKVKRAEVMRNIPRELNIFLTPRLPFVQVQVHEGGLYYLVSDDQLVLSSEALPRPELLVLEDFSSKRKDYSAGTLYQNEHFYGVSKLLAVLKVDPLFKGEAISKLALDQLGNISLILRDGLELKMGREFSVSDGTRLVLRSLLASKERSHMTYIDLRYQNLIIKRKSDLP